MNHDSLARQLRAFYFNHFCCEVEDEVGEGVL